MNPFWNTLIIAGWEDNEDGGKPFLGHITQKVRYYWDTCIGLVSIMDSLQGVAFEAKHTATGIASHLLTQVIEDETRDVSYLIFLFLHHSTIVVPYHNPLSLSLFRRLLLIVRRRNRSFVVQLNWRSTTIVWLTMNSRLE